MPKGRRDTEPGSTIGITLFLPPQMMAYFHEQQQLTKLHMNQLVSEIVQVWIVTRREQVQIAKEVAGVATETVLAGSQEKS